MNQQEFERITAAAQKLGLFGVRTEREGVQMFITFPDGLIMSYQIAKLLEMVKGYAMSMHSQGSSLVCKIW